MSLFSVQWVRRARWPPRGGQQCGLGTLTASRRSRRPKRPSGLPRRAHGPLMPTGLARRATGPCTGPNGPKRQRCTGHGAQRAGGYPGTLVTFRARGAVIGPLALLERPRGLTRALGPPREASRPYWVLYRT